MRKTAQTRSLEDSISAELEPLSALEGAPERVVIDRAASAVRRRLWDDVDIALDIHQRRFPSGALAEERDALRIEALARANRILEARERLQNFVERRPSSIHRSRLERLLVR